MSTLYIMCGVPGSGKSTFARKLEEKNDNIIHVSRDEIRFELVAEDEPYFSKETEVFKTFVKQIQNCLNNGYDVIADATHLNKASRVKLYRSLNLVGHKAAAVVISADLDTCIEHNNARYGTRAYVPVDQIKQMYNKFYTPNLENEPYLNCVYVIENGKIKSVFVKDFYEDLKLWED